MVPDGDLFAALRDGSASIVTDTIDTFTEKGIKVRSGEEIPADVVVTATGFNLTVFGDVAFTVDDEPVDFTEHITWRGMMISDVPNMAYMFGYFRHSWTLRIDLVGRRGGAAVRSDAGEGRLGGHAHAAAHRGGHAPAAVVGPGELQRRVRHALAAPPLSQGDHEPWTHMLEHEQERELLAKADLDDGTLVYR